MAWESPTYSEMGLVKLLPQWHSASVALVSWLEIVKKLARHASAQGRLAAMDRSQEACHNDLLVLEAVEMSNLVTA